MKSPPQIFNKKLLCDIWDKNIDNIIKTDFLYNHTTKLLVEKLSQIKLQYNKILIIGIVSPELYNFFQKKEITVVHFSEKYLDYIKIMQKVRVDDESLPFTDNSFDLVISNLDLHHLNDVPGYFIQIKNILKNQGLFLASFLGGESLHELRFSCLEADSKLGGASPKVSPFIDIKTAGMLLKRAGFFMPIADSETISVEYKTVEKLLIDLKNMAEGNILYKKSKSLMSKKKLNFIKNIYFKNFGNNDMITSTLELINLTAFKN